MFNAVLMYLVLVSPEMLYWLSTYSVEKQYWYLLRFECPNSCLDAWFTVKASALTVHKQCIRVHAYACACQRTERTTHVYISPQSLQLK